MLRVALTGGIGSGKSTVAELFAAHGVPIVDADVLARELTAPGGAALPAIRAAFGAWAIDADGGLDRAAMRERIFADASLRARLEALLHPEIRARMLTRLADLHAPYVLLVIPLLFETGQQELADRVLLVDVPEAVQIARVRARSGLSEAQVRAILAAQVTRARRLAGADDLIDNSGTRAALGPRVDALHRAYLAWAAGARPEACGSALR